VDRYKLACDHSKGKKVLDIACGVGKGSYMISTEGDASFVMGCDLNPSAIRYANHRNCHPQIAFQVQDAEQFLNDEEFDLVVSFETIEHLKDPAGFLENAKKNLRTGGQLIISTPIASVPLNTSPLNPYHIQEWGFLEFQNFIGKFFSIDTIYVQLYQNAVINEKLKAEFDKKNTSHPGRIKRLLRRLLSRSLPQPNQPAYALDWNSPLNQSKLEKYTGQYSAGKVGSVYPGYQLIICNKDNE
jgi:SAM-dependent methyltransferase